MHRIRAPELQGIHRHLKKRGIRHRDQRHVPFQAGQHSVPSQSTSWRNNGAQLIGVEVVGAHHAITSDQIRGSTQPHQHASQKCVGQLLPSGTGIQLGIERQRIQGRGMGAGHLQMLHQQMADHRLGPGKGIHTPTMAVGGQSLALRIIRETRHHSNRCGTSGLEALSSPQ